MTPTYITMHHRFQSSKNENFFQSREPKPSEPADTCFNHTDHLPCQALPLTFEPTSPERRHL
jgi:hypothetical protein